MRGTKSHTPTHVPHSPSLPHPALSMVPQEDGVVRPRGALLEHVTLQTKEPRREGGGGAQARS